MTYKLNGKVYGDLTVIRRSDVRNSRGKPLWQCKCKCGKSYLAVTNDLTSGKVKSCGNCNYHIEHKDAYISWMAAKSRCTNPNDADYPHYGGRGIAMCVRWQISFKNFYADMGDPPKDPITGERLSIDRIDVDGNYERSNCRWATRSEQQLNKQLHKRKEAGV